MDTHRKIVWVTRPEDQAQAICSLLNDRGMDAVRFPVITIQALVNYPGLTELFSRVHKFEQLVFASRNAVAITFQYYLEKKSFSGKPGFLAIGRSTAMELENRGIKDVLCAGANADSEALLALPELQSERVVDKKILLVRGAGGRNLLSKTLLDRGALVEIAEVYLRKRPQYDENKCKHLWQSLAPEAIMLTSNEGVSSLIALTPDAYEERLFQIPLIVMSERNAGYARRHGFIADIAVAREKNDAGLINAASELLETDTS